IYTITNKGATSALRGRSFYLQLLTEAAARFTLRELGLPITNLIYGGGGNFYILARASDKTKLDDLRQKISRILYQHHQGDLYIAIAGQELKASDFMRPASGNHPLSSKWGELARELAKVKNQRFSELTEKELAILFEPQGHGGNEDEECQVCGREHPQTTEVNKKQNGEGVRECPACKSYESLGKDLRNANYIGWELLPHPGAEQQVTAQVVSAGWEETLQDLGFRAKPTEKFDFSANTQRIWALSDDALTGAPKSPGHILIRRLMVNTTPRLEDDFQTSDGQQFKKGDIKPFEKLVDESTGIKRLGVLRMDVDNLGKLFESGLGSDATLSRIAALSSAIGLYFEGWVGKLAEKHQDKVYAIYSGGDDLFFVGAWNEMAELAREIRRDLAKYAANHPGIHASGGIVLVNDKYPLAKAAEDAGRAEEQAKSLKWWDEAGGEREKDALCFLGQPLQWARVGLDDNAENLNTSYGLMLYLKGLDNQSLVRTLLRHYEQYAEAETSRRREGTDLGKNERPQTLYGPWNWRILYTLKRNLKSETRLAEKFNADPAMMEWIGLAARWAELIRRNYSKEE
ncbi:MAG: type III-A CRISPR-associated protein Cas10/Csm1, partial [Anaerolineae bacterium]|nr:type III-A CRISPR-associated protein Cas10/Csm1 [Anaerolineae bacterium]